MAATKLTLRLEEEIIARGKAFAKEQGTSLSRLVEQFLRDKTEENNGYKPISVIEPDQELGELFPLNQNYSLPEKSMYEMRDEYYNCILNREKVEEE